VEDGVEVILNPLLPPRPADLTPRKIFSLDTERDEQAELGLGTIGESFAADSEDALYVLSPKNPAGLFLKFDRQGEFVKAFARPGQGPGEIQGVGMIAVSSRDEIVITDPTNRKLVYYSADGVLLGEKKFTPAISMAVPLPNGNIVAWNRVLDGSADYLVDNPLGLVNPDFKPIKELDRQKIPNPMRGKRLKGTYYIFSWSVSKDRIFSGLQERGYEIYVHDFDGKLVRKIRKEFAPVPVSDEHKKKFMKQFEAPLFDDIRSKFYFPDAMPAFNSLFADEKGRLFVMTYETVSASGESIFDVFDPEGIFVGRINLRVFHDDSGCRAKARNGRLYVLAEKDNGYRELVVYEMTWPK
jgi:hypothetical protein